MGMLASIVVRVLVDDGEPSTELLPALKKLMAGNPYPSLDATLRATLPEYLGKIRETADAIVVAPSEADMIRDAGDQILARIAASKADLRDLPGIPEIPLHSVDLGPSWACDLKRLGSLGRSVGFCYRGWEAHSPQGLSHVSVALSWRDTPQEASGLYERLAQRSVEENLLAVAVPRIGDRAGAWAGEIHGDLPGQEARLRLVVGSATRLWEFVLTGLPVAVTAERAAELAATCMSR